MSIFENNYITIRKSHIIEKNDISLLAILSVQNLMQIPKNCPYFCFTSIVFDFYCFKFKKDRNKRKSPFSQTRPNIEK